MTRSHSHSVCSAFVAQRYIYELSLSKQGCIFSEICGQTRTPLEMYDIFLHFKPGAFLLHNMHFKAYICVIELESVVGALVGSPARLQAQSLFLSAIQRLVSATSTIIKLGQSETAAPFKYVDFGIQVSGYQYESLTMSSFFQIVLLSCLSSSRSRPLLLLTLPLSPSDNI